MLLAQAQLLLLEAGREIPVLHGTGIIWGVPHCPAGSWPLHAIHRLTLVSFAAVLISAPAKCKSRQLSPAAG